MAELVLLLSNDSEKTDRIKNLCEGLEMGLKLLGQKDINTPIGKLLPVPMGGSTTGRKAPMLYMAPEVMMFFGISDSRLDVFLEAYKASGIPPIPLKGVITMHNAGWNLYEIISEYEKERAGYGL